MNYINLGCGRRFHPAWTNIDFVSTGPDVLAHNLLEGIPFPGNYFDFAYHSHVLEHFSKDAAPHLIQECYRVLKPGGILRVVIPDLEQVVRAYLKALEESLAGSAEWQQNYEWIMLELYDQTVRNYPGGAMKNYLSKPDVPGWQFIVERCGSEAIHIRQDDTKEKRSDNVLERFVQKATRVIKQPRLIKAKLNDLKQIPLKALLGKDYELLQIGKFRKNGEIHQWMYDRYSLKKLLEDQGFEAVIVRQANESYLPEWADFNLDTDFNGKVFKPDSLFIEARKPNSTQV